MLSKNRYRSASLDLSEENGAKNEHSVYNESLFILRLLETLFSSTKREAMTQRSSKRTHLEITGVTGMYAVCCCQIFADLGPKNSIKWFSLILVSI